MNNTGNAQIIPYYTQPYVHTVINDNTFYEETVAVTDADERPYGTAIVVGADQGIDNVFVGLTDLDVKKEIFGEGDFQKYGQPSIQADVLFNNYTKVWLMRVLPDNATYANLIILAHYRRGKILDDLGQETGKYRLEIKFSTINVTSELLNGGAVTDESIVNYAQTLIKNTTDPLTGYMTVPLFYVRSIGRGIYGNNYSISITRDYNAEREFEVKMYDFNLINNNNFTKINRIFAGSLYQSLAYGTSTLIDDVIDQYTLGSAPVMIHSFENNFLTIFSTYKKIIADNVKYLQKSGASEEDLEELSIAQSITEKTFDPLFGLVYDTQTDELIPYYRNYTEGDTAWVKPDYEVPNVAGATKPLNISEWSSAKVGAKVLVAADPLHNGYRWLYTVTTINNKTGNIVYDDGVETSIDADQYTGIKLSQDIGHSLDGGSDGDFEKVTIKGETRTPTSAEMKLLLAKEYVKAFRGYKDRRILSPARINLDYMFDACYNLSSTETLELQVHTVPLYNYSSILTDKDAQQLAVLGSYGYDLEFTDLNVKKAMYDLNEFRNKNGMKISNERGAGCSLYLDCGLVGMKNIDVNYELVHVIKSMESFIGRAASVDFGYYKVFDPKTGRKVDVTVTYKMAKDMGNHIGKYGINIPYTGEYAQITAIQREGEFVVSGEMIRDSFKPDLDLIDWDVKEMLNVNRINYWVTSNEGRVVQRSTQNTRQLEASALLEENNVRVLNTLKKGLERACARYHYKWNDPAARKGYTDSQMKVYAPWIGTLVEDLQIRFEANEFEQKRMMMHCYADVKFRDIVKRIILEININRPDYSNSTTGGVN